MRPFTVADLNANGELRLKAEYEYALLEQLPGAADLIGQFAGWLWRSPDEFEEPLTRLRRGLVLRWRATAPAAGLATLRDADGLLSLSLLASGVDPSADQLTFEAFQNHLVRELHDTGFEPAFALMDLRERPLVATINFALPARKDDRHTFALADRCFAAAYFRKIGLS